MEMAYVAERPATVEARQKLATDAWVSSVLFNNRDMGEAEARAFVEDLIANGHDLPVRNIVTYAWEPNHTNYTWNDGGWGHWCPGYYNCLRCYAD